jgi:hypothetical protein
MNTNTNTDAELSLCIPRVFANIDEKRVRSVIEQLLGKISRVDIIERTNEKGEKYKRVFVHFDHWFETADAQTAKSRLIEGKEIKIVYDDPWFWKVSANKVSVNTRPKQRINLQQQIAKPPPRLELDESREPQRLDNRSSYNQDPRNYRHHDPRGYNQDPRDYRHQDPRGYNQDPRDYRHQDPRDYRQQDPRDYRHQDPRDYRQQQDPRDYRQQQEPKVYKQPIASALQVPNPTMEAKPVSVAVTVPVKEAKVKEAKVKQAKVKEEPIKYKKPIKNKKIINPEPELESGEETPAASAQVEAPESQEQK